MMFKQTGLKQVFSSVLSIALVFSLISIFPAATSAARNPVVTIPEGSVNLLDAALFTPIADENLKVSSEHGDHKGVDALLSEGSGYWRNSSKNVYMDNYSPSSLTLTLDLGTPKTIDKLYLEMPNTIPNIQSNATRFEVYYSNDIAAWESAPTATDETQYYNWKANGWTLAGGTETEGMWSYIKHDGEQWGFDTKNFLYPFTSRYVMINTVLVGPKSSRVDDIASQMGISGLEIYGKDPIVNTTVLNPAKDKYSTWDQTTPVTTAISFAAGQELMSITEGSSTLTAGTDYIIFGNIVTFTADYLAKQRLGTIEFEFHYNDGVPSIFALDVVAYGYGANEKTIKINAIEGVSPYNVLGAAMATDEPVEGITKRIRDAYHAYYGNQPKATAADDHIINEWDETLNKYVYKVIANGRGMDNEFEDKIVDGEYGHKGIFDWDKGYVVDGARINDRQRIEIRPSEDSNGDFVAYEGDLVAYEWNWNIPDGEQWNQKNFRHLFQLKAVNAHKKDTLPGGNTGGENGAYILAMSISGTTTRDLVVNHNRYDGDKTMMRIPITEIGGHWIKVELQALIADSGWFTVKITDMETDKVYYFDNLDVYKEFSDKGSADGVKDLWRRPERTGGFETEYPATFDQYVRPKWGIYRSSNGGTNSVYDAELQLSDIVISKLETGLSSSNLAYNKKAYNVGSVAGANAVQLQSANGNEYGNANKLTNGVLEEQQKWDVADVTSLEQIGDYSWLGTDGERKGSFIIDLGQAMDFSQIRLFAKSTRLKGATVYLTTNVGDYTAASDFENVEFKQIDKKTAEGYTFATGTNDGGIDTADSSYPIDLGNTYHSRYIKVTVENASGSNKGTDLTGPPRLTQVQVFNAPAPPQNLIINKSGLEKMVNWDANALSEGYIVYHGAEVLAELAGDVTSFDLPEDVSDLSSISVKAKGTDPYSRKLMVSAPASPQLVTAESITLSKDKLTMNNGESAKLEANISPRLALNTVVVWESSDSTVVKVDQTGRISAVKTGSATITASIEGTELKAEATITVTSSSGGSVSPETTPDNTITPPDQSTDGIIDIEKDAQVTKKKADNGNSVTKIVVDEAKLKKALAAPIVVIAANNDDSSVEFEFPGNAIQAAIGKQKNTVIRIKVNGASYELPINLLKDIPQDSIVSIVISKVAGKAGADISTAVKGLNGESLLSSPIEFLVMVNGKPIADFAGVFVNRTISLSTSINDASKVAVLRSNAEGQLVFVPAVMAAKGEITIRSPYNGIYTVIISNKSFKDLQGHWAKAAIELLANKRIFNGKTEQEFAPNVPITRAEFSVMLVRSLGLAEVKIDRFNDVQASDWFASAVGTASNAALINGYGDGSFSPNASITREEMVMMLIRAMKVGGKEIEADVALLNRFSDRSDFSDWSKNAISQALTAGLVLGVTDNTFAPNESATRAQAAVMLQRMLQSLQFIN